MITSAVSPCNNPFGCYTPSVQSSNASTPSNPFATEPSSIYGDNGEPMQDKWSGVGTAGAWTVHAYANRYVVWTAEGGTYVIGRLPTGTYIPGYPNNYMGPGYIGQFSPNYGPANKLLVNDPLQPGTAGPRDGVHGGLGCFAVDFDRVVNNVDHLVDLNCRRSSLNGSPGVDDITYDNVSGDPLGVWVVITTRYRDEFDTVFSVTYTHRFQAAYVKTTVTWQSNATLSNAYIKEPRVVAVLGTSDVPVYNGVGKIRSLPPNCWDVQNDLTTGGGNGIWALEPNLQRQEAFHHFLMPDVSPWCSTITVGPGATDQNRRYHRGGFSVNVVNASHPQNLSVEDFGFNHDYDGIPNPSGEVNFNRWRQQADPTPGRYTGSCQGGDPREHCRMPICDVCAANAWEIGRIPGQYGVFVAMEAWRASISIDDYLGRARQLPPSGTAYDEEFKFGPP